MASQNFETGRTQLSRQLLDGAASLAGPAADLASGAGILKTATNALKDAALDKLLGPTAVFAGGLVAALRTIRAIVRESGILEKGLKQIASVQGITGKFETLLGSATAAKRRIEELYRFVARSPFDFRDVAEANRTLQALTKGAFANTRAMELVGDMAAATGQSMSEAADRVAKLYAALASGRSFEKIAFQLQQSGVVTDELAMKLEALEASGATFSQKWAEVEKVLGRTSGGMKNEVETLDALNTRLDAANALFAQAFGEPYVEAQTKALKVMIAATQNLTPLIGEIGQDFALVPTFIRDAKTSLLDAVGASQRFADALRIAYRVGVSLFVGLLGSTVVMAARNLIGIGSAALATATGMRTLYVASMTTAAATRALATASALATAAGKAFAEGNLLSAATLQAESLWLATKTRALAANAAAARLAGAGTATYSVGAHAANLATAGLAGGLALARKAFVFVAGAARASAVAFLTNPWAVAAAAVLTVGTALYKWGTAQRQAAKDARELAEHVTNTNRALDEQLAAIKSLSDWDTAVQKLKQRYSDLTAEVLAFNRSVEQGKEPTSEEIATNEKNVAEWKLTRAALDKTRRMPTRNLDLSDAEKENIRQDQAEKRAARDRDYRIKLSAAQTDEQKLAVMDARRLELESRVRDGRAAKAGEREALRDGSAQRRLELQQQRDDLVAKFDQRETLATDRRDAAADREANSTGLARVAAHGSRMNAENEIVAIRAARAAALDPVDAALRNLSLNSASPVVRAQAQLDEAVRKSKGPDEVERLTRALDDAKAAVSGLADAEAELAEHTANATQEERNLGRARATQNMTNEFDARIAAAAKAGRPTAGIEFDKNMALAEVERNDAQTAEDKQAAQNKIDSMLAERESGRRQVAQERARNAALARGDRKGARAIEDAGALREKINQYAGLGLSAKDAERDFRANLIAEAVNRPPQIVTDSLQNIGGGGGFYQGADPEKVAKERADRAQKTAEQVASAVELLREIRDRMDEN